MKFNIPNWLRLFVTGNVFLLFFAGIIRHDVPLEKYRRFTRKKMFDCIGAVYQNDSILSGSCTLITPRHVLTAAHLTSLSDSLIKNAFCELNGKRVGIKNKFFFPGFKSGKSFGDVAILELKEEVVDVVPAGINRQNNELGKTAAIAGYGTFGTGKKFGTVREYPRKKLAGMNTIDSLGGTINAENGLKTLMFVDLDSPLKEKRNPLGKARPLKLEFVTDAGDSGGGLFIKQNGKWLLSGVTCYGTNYDSRFGNYGQVCAYTRTSVFYPWIQSVIEGNGSPLSKVGSSKR